MILTRFRRLFGTAALLLALAPVAQAGQQLVKVGTRPGDGTGDQLPVAITKLNANDTELYASTASLQAQLAALQAVSGRLAALQAGTIDGVVIGGSTPAAGRFTTLNVSGGITGTLIGNASTATLATSASALAQIRTIAFTGDAACTFLFDGSANAGCSLTLANSGVTAGTYGSSLAIPVVTVDAKGRVTGITTAGNGGGSGTPTSRQILTSGLATGGGDLTADRTITVPKASAAMASAGTDDASAVTPLALATPLATRVPTTRQVLAGSGLTGGGALSGDVTVALGVGSAVRGDVAQAFTSGQQDQVRANIGGPVASAPSTSATLAAADIDRPLFPTGAITLTVPNGGAGWRTGPIRNANTATGLVTLAVPSGATLDGVTNGTTVLYPYQRARIVQTGATAYATDWVERSPIIAVTVVPSASAQATIDLVLPAGYSKFEIEFRDLTNATAGVFARYRLTDDGFATVKSGSTDYTNLYLLTYSTTVASNGPAADYGIISANVARQSSGDPAMSGTIKISPGGSIAPAANNRATVITEAAYVNGNTPAYEVDKIWTACASITTRANGIRIYASSGNISGSFTLRGIP